jgi:predicted enzyme related to lactoylglutathione lyase
MTPRDVQEIDPETGPPRGSIEYLQIPATDIEKSGAFYERIFGWHVEHRNPSFEAPNVIGQWVTDRPAAGDGGILVWIRVDNIEVALEMARSDGGEVLEQPVADGPERMLATIRDPAGNVLGIVQHGPH